MLIPSSWLPMSIVMNVCPKGLSQGSLHQCSMFDNPFIKTSKTIDMSNYGLDINTSQHAYVGKPLANTAAARIVCVKPDLRLTAISS